MADENFETMPTNESSAARLLKSENLKNVIKELFTDAIILTTEVKKGARSSSNIYVNKKYEGKSATVIIWKDK